MSALLAAGLMIVVPFVTSAPARAAHTAYVDPAIVGSTHSRAVIVQGSSAASVRDAVIGSGGRVTRMLPIVDGVAATVPGSAIRALQMTPGIHAVTRNQLVRVAATGNGGGAAEGTPVHNVLDQEVGAAALRKATGADGKGVTVALVDTGIANVPDLAGRVLPVTDDRTGTTSPCLNLSGDKDCSDAYGHGTFVAGLIAGDGKASNGAIKGMAPRANLVSIKIAGANGAADVSTVLAAIQWTVSFRDRYQIRVLNLSLGTDSTQSYKVDPLDYAVERAWSSGIVVVVAASNRGPSAGTISKPGDDPFVITVGAVDDKGTADVRDDSLPNFSGRGPTAADRLPKPDLVAPGAHLISLNAPGSSIETQFPTNVTAFNGAYRRGSGTSMATALVSGAAALLAQRQPAITPDRVKYILGATAGAVASPDVMAVGDGLLDVFHAASFAPAGLANQGVERSSGMGSLDASRGHVATVTQDPKRTLLSGTTQTAQLVVWDPKAFVTGDWTGSSWYGSSWYGSSWYGSSWYGAWG